MHVCVRTCVCVCVCVCVFYWAPFCNPLWRSTEAGEGLDFTFIHIKEDGQAISFAKSGHEKVDLSLQQV